MASFNLTAQLNISGPANLKPVISNIRKQLSSINPNINININTANLASSSKSLQDLNTNLKNITVSATSAADAMRRFGASVGSVNMSSLPKTMSAATQQSQQLQQQQTRTAQTIKESGDSMADFGRQSALAIRRFAAFTLVTGIIYKFTGALSSASDEFMKFNKQMVQLSQVTGTSLPGLAGLEREITSLSTSLGVSSSSLIDISSTLAQAGLSAQETEQALKALAKSTLAPSFDDLNSTVEGSIALMRQFSISTAELDGALGSINAVAAKFAVEAGDIITAIQRTGGVFAASSKGVSEGTQALNEFIAVFTSIRATTRESAETIATGLRTIFTRLQRRETIDTLKQFGVQLTDLEGKFVGPYEAVKRLSQGLAGLDTRDIRFSSIIEELGGFRQVGKVIPLLQQFATAEKALGVAQRGQGSLTADAAKAQQALAIQMTKVQEEFISLVRKIGSSNEFQTMVKLALNLASAFISVADSAKHALPAITALLAIKGTIGAFRFASGFMGGMRGGGGGRGVGDRMSGAPKGFAGGGQVPVALEAGEMVFNGKQAVKAAGGAGKLLSWNRTGKRPDTLNRAGGGGVFMVPGSGRGDNFKTTLEEGSVVVKRQSVRKAFPELAAANGGRIGYAPGGEVKATIKQLGRQSKGGESIRQFQSKNVDYVNNRDMAAAVEVNRMNIELTETEQKFLQKKASGVKGRWREFNKGVWADGFETIALRRLGQKNWRRTSRTGEAGGKTAPIDLLSGNFNEAQLAEVKFTHESRPVSDRHALNKLLRFKMIAAGNDPQKMGFTTKIGEKVPLGTITVVQPSNKGKFLEFFSPGYKDEDRNKKKTRRRRAAIGGLIQRLSGGTNEPLAETETPITAGRAAIIQGLLSNKKRFPDMRAINALIGGRDARKVLGGKNPSGPDFQKLMAEYGKVTASKTAKKAKSKRLASTREFGVLGLRGPSGTSQETTPLLKSKTKGTFKPKDVSVQKGVLSGFLSKRLEAIARKGYRETVAQMAAVLADRAGTPAVSDKKALNAIIKKTFQGGGLGQMFESAVAAADSRSFYPTGKINTPMDLPKGSGVAGLFGVKGGIPTDVTVNTEENKTAQMGRFLRDKKLRRSRKALGGQVQRLAIGGRASRSPGKLVPPEKVGLLATNKPKKLGISSYDEVLTNVDKNERDHIARYLAAGDYDPNSEETRKYIQERINQRNAKLSQRTNVSALTESLKTQPAITTENQRRIANEQRSILPDPQYAPPRSPFERPMGLLPGMRRLSIGGNVQRQRLANAGKVTDQTFYHGTGHDLDELDPTKSPGGLLGAGVYVGLNKTGLAADYAKKGMKRSGGKGGIYPVKIKGGISDFPEASAPLSKKILPAIQNIFKTKKISTSGINLKTAPFDSVLEFMTAQLAEKMEPELRKKGGINPQYEAIKIASQEIREELVKRKIRGAKKIAGRDLDGQMAAIYDPKAITGIGKPIRPKRNRFAIGGNVQRLVGGTSSGPLRYRKRITGLLDVDKLRDSKRAREAMQKLGFYNPKKDTYDVSGYRDSLANAALAERQKKNGAVDYMAADLGSPGAGKSTFGLKGKGSKRYIETIEDLEEMIASGNRVSIRNAMASLDEDKIRHLSKYDRIRVLSSTTPEEMKELKKRLKNRTRQGKESIAATGVDTSTQFGRKHTIKAQSSEDTEAMLRFKDENGKQIIDESKIATYSISTGKRKKAHEVPMVRHEALNVIKGGFGPTTREGHVEGLFKKAKKDKKLLINVGPDESLTDEDLQEILSGSGKAHGARTVIFDRKTRKKMVEKSVKDENLDAYVSTSGDGFGLADMFKVGKDPKTGQSIYTQPDKKKSTIVIGEDRAGSEQKYRDMGYDNVQIVPRGEGAASASKVRDDMFEKRDFSGVTPSVRKMLEEASQRGVFENTLNTLPKVVQHVQKKAQAKIASIDLDLDKLLTSVPGGRLTEAFTKQNPELAKEIKRLRAKKSDIKGSAKRSDIHAAMRNLKRRYPEKYDFDMGDEEESSFKPMRPFTGKRFQTAAIGGLIQRFSRGTSSPLSKSKTKEGILLSSLKQNKTTGEVFRDNNSTIRQILRIGDLDSSLSEIQKAYGIKDAKFLGSGGENVAFDIGGDRVLKISRTGKGIQQLARENGVGKRGVEKMGNYQLPMGVKGVSGYRDTKTFGPLTASIQDKVVTRDDDKATRDAELLQGRLAKRGKIWIDVDPSNMGYDKKGKPTVIDGMVLRKSYVEKMRPDYSEDHLTDAAIAESKLDMWLKKRQQKRAKKSPGGAKKLAGGTSKPLSSNVPGEIPIMAQEGEFVLNKHATGQIGPHTLKKLNRGGKVATNALDSLPKYHTGGMVQKFAGGTSKPLSPAVTSTSKSVPVVKSKEPPRLFPDEVAKIEKGLLAKIASIKDPTLQKNLRLEVETVFGGDEGARSTFQMLTSVKEGQKEKVLSEIIRITKKVKNLTNPTAVTNVVSTQTKPQVSTQTPTKPANPAVVTNVVSSQSPTKPTNPAPIIKTVSATTPTKPQASTQTKLATPPPKPANPAAVANTVATQTKLAAPAPPPKPAPTKPSPVPTNDPRIVASSFWDGTTGEGRRSLLGVAPNADMPGIHRKSFDQLSPAEQNAVISKVTGNPVQPQQGMSPSAAPSVQAPIKPAAPPPQPPTPQQKAAARLNSLAVGPKPAPPPPPPGPVLPKSSNIAPISSNFLDRLTQEQRVDAKAALAAGRGYAINTKDIGIKKKPSDLTSIDPKTGLPYGVKHKAAVAPPPPRKHAIGGIVQKFNKGSSAPLASKAVKPTNHIGISSTPHMITAIYLGAGKKGAVQAKEIGDGVWTVGMSGVSVKGSGPGLYDAVMREVTKRGGVLTADRNVRSAAAQGIWKGYSEKRNEDSEKYGPKVDRKPLDPKYHTSIRQSGNKDIPASDDPMEYGYSLSSPTPDHTKIHTLGKEHDKTVQHEVMGALYLQRKAYGGNIRPLSRKPSLAPKPQIQNNNELNTIQSQINNLELRRQALNSHTKIGLFGGKSNPYQRELHEVEDEIARLSQRKYRLSKSSQPTTTTRSSILPVPARLLPPPVATRQAPTPKQTTVVPQSRPAPVPARSSIPPRLPTQVAPKAKPQIKNNELQVIQSQINDLKHREATLNSHTKTSFFGGKSNPYQVELHKLQDEIDRLSQRKYRLEQSSAPNRFAAGGEIPIMAKEGEFVINDYAAGQIGHSTLKKLNRGGRVAINTLEKLPKYHSGGSVQKFAVGGQVGAALDAMSPRDAAKLRASIQSNAAAFEKLEKGVENWPISDVQAAMKKLARTIEKGGSEIDLKPLENITADAKNKKIEEQSNKQVAMDLGMSEEDATRDAKAKTAERFDPATTAKQEKKERVGSPSYGPANVQNKGVTSSANFEANRAKTVQDLQDFEKNKYQEARKSGKTATEARDYARNEAIEKTKTLVKPMSKKEEKYVAAKARRTAIESGASQEEAQRIGATAVETAKEKRKAQTQGAAIYATASMTGQDPQKALIASGRGDIVVPKRKQTYSDRAEQYSATSSRLKGKASSMSQGGTSGSAIVATLNKSFAPLVSGASKVAGGMAKLHSGAAALAGGFSKASSGAGSFFSTLRNNPAKAFNQAINSAINGMGRLVKGADSAVGSLMGMKKVDIGGGKQGWRSTGNGIMGQVGGFFGMGGGGTMGDDGVTRGPDGKRKKGFGGGGRKGGGGGGMGGMGMYMGEMALSMAGSSAIESMAKNAGGGETLEGRLTSHIGGSMVSGASTGMMLGSMAGGAIGSIIPGAGNVIGAAGGAAIGAGVGAIAGGFNGLATQGEVRDQFASEQRAAKFSKVQEKMSSGLNIMKDTSLSSKTRDEARKNVMTSFDIQASLGEEEQKAGLKNKRTWGEFAMGKGTVWGGKGALFGPDKEIQYGGQQTKTDKERVEAAQPLAESAKTVLAAEMERTGKGLKELESSMPKGEFDKLSRAIALSDEGYQSLSSAAKQQIEKINSSGDSEEQKKQKIDQINATLARQQGMAVERQAAELKVKEEAIKTAKANATLMQAMQKVTTSFEKMATAMTAAASRADKVMENGKLGIEAVDNPMAAVQQGQISQSADILSNPEAYSMNDVEGALRQNASMAGSSSEAMVQSAMLPRKLEQNFGTAMQEAKAGGKDDAGTRDAVKKAMMGTVTQAFGPDIASGMSEEINKFLNGFEGDIREVKFDDLIKKFPELANTVAASEKTFAALQKQSETAAKAIGMIGDAAQKSAGKGQEIRNRDADTYSTVANSTLAFRRATGEKISYQADAGVRNQARATRLGTSAQVAASPQAMLDRYNQLNKATGTAATAQQQITEANRPALLSGDENQSSSAIKAMENAARTTAEFAQATQQARDEIMNLPNDIKENIGGIMQELQDVMQERAAKIGAAGGLMEKMLTSTPKDLRKMGNTFNNLNQTLSGKGVSFEQSHSANTAYNQVRKQGGNHMQAQRAAQEAYAQESGDTLSMAKELAPLLGAVDPEAQNKMMGSVYENMFAARGMDTSKMMVGDKSMKDYIEMMKAGGKKDPKVEALQNALAAQQGALQAANDAAKELIAQEAEALTTKTGAAVLDAMIQGAEAVRVAVAEGKQVGITPPGEVGKPGAPQGKAPLGEKERQAKKAENEGKIAEAQKILNSGTASADDTEEARRTILAAEQENAVLFGDSKGRNNLSASADTMNYKDHQLEGETEEEFNKRKQKLHEMSAGTQPPPSTTPPQPKQATTAQAAANSQQAAAPAPATGTGQPAAAPVPATATGQPAAPTRSSQAATPAPTTNAVDETEQSKKNFDAERTSSEQTAKTATEAAIVGAKPVSAPQQPQKVMSREELKAQRSEDSKRLALKGAIGDYRKQAEADPEGKTLDKTGVMTNKEFLADKEQQLSGMQDKFDEKNPELAAKRKKNAEDSQRRAKNGKKNGEAQQPAIPAEAVPLPEEAPLTEEEISFFNPGYKAPAATSQQPPQATGAQASANGQQASSPVPQTTSPTPPAPGTQAPTSAPNATGAQSTSTGQQASAPVSQTNAPTAPATGQPQRQGPMSYEEIRTQKKKQYEQSRYQKQQQYLSGFNEETREKMKQKLGSRLLENPNPTPASAQNNQSPGTAATSGSSGSSAAPQASAPMGAPVAAPRTPQGQASQNQGAGVLSNNGFEAFASKLDTLLTKLAQVNIPTEIRLTSEQLGVNVTLNGGEVMANLPAQLKKDILREAGEQLANYDRAGPGEGTARSAGVMGGQQV